MNGIAKILSLVALILVVVPCALFFAGKIGLDAVNWTALAGSIGWSIPTPVWMSRELPVDAGEVEI